MKKHGLTTLRTIFLYRSQQAYFQIFLENENSTCLAGEYPDYETYKAAYDHFYAALSEPNLVNVVPMREIFSKKKISAQ